MQAFDKNDKAITDPTPFEEEGLKELLKKPEVDHVRVFHLQKGDELNIKGHVWVVTKVLNNGRAVIKRRKG